jgi:hypothetical protein
LQWSQSNMTSFMMPLSEIHRDFTKLVHNA